MSVPRNEAFPGALKQLYASQVDADSWRAHLLGKVFIVIVASLLRPGRPPVGPWHLSVQTPTSMQQRTLREQMVIRHADLHDMVSQLLHMFSTLALDVMDRRFAQERPEA